MRWRCAALVIPLLVGAGCFNFGSLEGPAQDAGSTQDGSTRAPDGDAGSSGDAQTPLGDGGSFCASQPDGTTFCDDFENYQSSTISEWDQTMAAGGSVGLTSAAFQGLAAMSAQANAVDASVYVEDDILKAFPNFTGGVTIKLTFEMNILEWDTNPAGQIIAVEVIFKNSGAQFNQLVMNINALGGTGGVSAQLAENATGTDGGEIGYVSYPFESHPKTNAWQKVDITLTLPNTTQTAVSNTVTIAIDGVTQIDKQALKVPLQGGIPYVHLGIGSAITPIDAPWVVHYDNFAATLTSF